MPYVGNIIEKRILLVWGMFSVSDYTLFIGTKPGIPSIGSILSFRRYKRQ